jgi:alcohol/geraniol dehydrogenase (NADP+)
MPKIRAYATHAAHGALAPYEYDPGELRPDQVEIAVTHCGICHSDVAMLNNDWGFSSYPLVGGHEVVGTVAALGENVKTLTIGQTVGLGWFSGSCNACRTCLGGDQNLCATAEQTIVGRPGGFADRVRAQSTWVIPLPEGVDPAKAGPLFCGGITVFNPLIQFDVRPTQRVGVVGIGGLGHMALLFLKHWGSDVVAFTSPSKMDEALALGATRAVSSRDASTFAGLKGTLDFILVTASASLDWSAYIDLLAPKGRLHFVGAVAEPVSTSVFPLLFGQKSISGSPLGSPSTTATMLEFAARHKVAPLTETFPMSEINAALKHVESGQARYRVVLENDWT